MSEYIMGLGISVKICKIYEELIYITFSESDMTDEYYDNIAKLRDLIDDETDTYDKLDFEDLEKYFNKISNEDTSSFDAVKSRYYSKIRERKDLMEDGIDKGYPFTLNTALVGKVLLESMINMEKYFLHELDLNVDIDNESFYDLFSFHKVYKFTLLSMNDFVERLAVNFDFHLTDIPNISFDKIKNNFKCNNNFYNYLDNLLLILSKEIIDVLLNNNGNDEIYGNYSTLLNIFQLEVILSYLNKDSLLILNDYCNNNLVDSSINGKYIRKLFENNRGGKNV